MWKPAEQLVLRRGDRELLEGLVAGYRIPERIVLRARVVLAAAERRSNSSIAADHGVTRTTVLLWRGRYDECGIDGLLKDAPRPGRKKRISGKKVEAIINATLHSVPRDATHGSSREMARQQGVSAATVLTNGRAHRLQPPRTTRFKLSRDPEFVSKIRDVVGLYLNPPRFVPQRVGPCDGDQAVPSGTQRKPTPLHLDGHRFIYLSQNQAL